MLIPASQLQVGDVVLLPGGSGPHKILELRDTDPDTRVRALLAAPTHEPWAWWGWGPDEQVEVQR